MNWESLARLSSIIRKLADVEIKSGEIEVISRSSGKDASGLIGSGPGADYI